MKFSEGGFFFYIIYIALSIASINTMILMQLLRLWSAANALQIPQCYQLQFFTCVVHCCLSFLPVFVSNLVVDVLGSQRAPAASSQLAVAIFVFSRKATRAVFLLL
jgi:hypothetical protein